MSSKLLSYISLIRLNQWSKNLFIFLPLFFGGEITNIKLFCTCIYSFCVFSFIASAVYCYNDIIDYKSDRQHPNKSRRPIASGALSIKEGYAILFLCLLISIFLFFIANLVWYSCLILLLYLIMNVAYCNVLKKYAIVDVFIISLGFVFRVYFGAITTGIVPSEWIIILTFLLALFLAFAKRRDDVVLFEKTGKFTRFSTSKYNLIFIDQIMTILATIIIISYIIYCISPNVTQRFQCNYIYITTIFVLGGIIRYLQLSTVENNSGSPTKIFLKDHVIHGCIIGWLILFSLIIYIF